LTFSVKYVLLDSKVYLICDRNENQKIVVTIDGIASEHEYKSSKSEDEVGVSSRRRYI
jgi:hypothetical protein